MNNVQQVIFHFMFSIEAIIVFYTLYMMQEGKCSSGNRLTTLFVCVQESVQYIKQQCNEQYSFFIHFFVQYYVHFSLQSGVQFCVNYGVHCKLECTIKQTVHCKVNFRIYINKEASFSYRRSHFNQQIRRLFSVQCIVKCTVHCK